MQSIKITYSNPKLRILIEEFIAMQKAEFSFQGVCSYILYRAMEEERTTNTGLYVSNQLDAADCDRVRVILDKIVGEGWIEEKVSNNEKRYLKN